MNIDYNFLLQLNWLWIILGKVLVITLLTYLIISIKEKVFIKLINKHTSKDKTSYFYIFCTVAKKPASAFIILLAFTFTMNVLGEYVDKKAIFIWINPVRTIGIIAILVWIGTRFIYKTEQEVLSEKITFASIDQTSVIAASKLAHILVYIAGALVILPTIGVPISGVLALGGVGGMAVAFASQNIIANFLGGAVLHAERPFSVGDLIDSPDKDIAGRIISIGWRTTKIKRMDRRIMYVPNATFSTINVINTSKRKHSRIYQNIGIRYKDLDSLPKIVDDIKEMLMQHKDIDTKDIMFVGLTELSDSALECLIWCFTNKTTKLTYLKVVEDILLKVLKIVEKHGAEIPFPTSTINIAEKIQLEYIEKPH